MNIKLQLTVSADRDDYATRLQNGQSTGQIIASVLRTQVAPALRDGHEDRPIIDDNGNTVGHWYLTTDGA